MSNSFTRLTTPMPSTARSRPVPARRLHDWFAALLVYSVQLVCRAFLRSSRILLITAASFLPVGSAQNGPGLDGPGPGPGPITPYNGSVPHLTAADTFRGNAQTSFFVADWIRRGIAIRYGGDTAKCYDSLIATLNSVINIRLAEYSGSAGVLSLLPTIGALLGAPTNEIWRLWTVVPFGGVLTMMLSFGGAILPIKIEDYERDLSRGNGLIGKIVSFRSPAPGEAPEDEIGEKMTQLSDKLRARMARKVPRDTFNGTLTMGLMGMASLLVGAHASMAMVEQGGILPWFCTCRWWMHLWYILVTITAVAENWSNLPFDQQWRLFVSDVPYHVEIRDGDDIMNQLSTNDESVSRSLRRLGRLRAGRVIHKGSRVKTQAVNTVIIMVSVVAHDSTFRSVKRLVTKMSSLGVFVTGTAFFAAVQLLALPMAVMVLTFILAAGVFGRGFANWIVTRIDREEPVIHIIVKDAREAHQVISRILELDDKDLPDEDAMADDKVRRLIQVEIGGHVFIKHRRVAHRSRWHVLVWGIMADPFDLRHTGEDELDTNHQRLEPLFKGTTSYSTPSVRGDYGLLTHNGP